MTLAPGLTLWDAGEFLSAVETLGVPHPPGTPLYVLIGYAWRRALWWMELARAMNLFSAASTVAAAILAGRLMARWTGVTAAGVAGALIAGTMSSAWSSATETEVYAVALVLAMAMIATADAAGREGGYRWLLATAYLIALAVPLHLSAIVATPVAMVLAAAPPVGGRWRLGRMAILGGAALLAIGVSGVSWPLVLLGVTVAAVGSMIDSSGVPSRWKRVALALGIIGVCAVALSAVTFMLLRAAHDPGLNQGDPSTVSRWLDVIARRQYSLAPLWPRRAPVWLQLANVLQYADWQIALGIAPEPYFSPPRTFAALVFVALGVVGGREHWRRDRRTGLAVGTLIAAGTLGVAAQLNLSAGPSIGWGILPDSAPHEPRERDYFFVLGFWGWGLWAGLGAAALLRRNVPRFVAATPLVALLPLVLNWPVANRSAEPRASLAVVSARAFLESAPRRAVLLTAGDNDTYPLWYAQLVEQVRPDVVTVAIPLLGADWYRAELARRHRLLTEREVAGWYGMGATARALAREADRQGRPVSATLAVLPSDLDGLTREWEVRGWARVPAPVVSAAAAIPVDRQLVADVWRLLEASSDPSVPLTPAEQYVLGLLACGEPIRIRSGERRADSLDSRCNYR